MNSFLPNLVHFIVPDMVNSSATIYFRHPLLKDIVSAQPSAFLKETIHNLLNGNVTKRTNAAKVLGWFGDRYALDFLYSALEHDEEESVRKEAAQSICIIGGESVLDDMIDAFIRDEQIRSTIMPFLCSYGEKTRPYILDILLELSETPDKNLLFVALHCARFVCRPEDKIAILPYLENEHYPLLQCEAAKVLAELGGFRDAAIIFSLLNSTKHNEYLTVPFNNGVFEALSLFDKETIADCLLVFIADEGNHSENRIAAIRILIDKEYIIPMENGLRILRELKLDEVREKFVSLCCKNNNLSAIKMLTSFVREEKDVFLLKTTFQEYKEADACMAFQPLLSLLVSVSMMPLIRELPDYEQWKALKDCAMCCGSVMQREDMAFLVKVFKKNKDNRIRELLLEILKVQHYPEAVPLLISVLNSKDDFLLIHALVTLQPYDEPALIKPLRELLYHPRAACAAYASEILANIDDDEAIDIVLKVAQFHPDSSVRYSAVKALEKVGEPWLQYPLLQILEREPGHTIQRAVLETLIKIPMSHVCRIHITPYLTSEKRDLRYAALRALADDPPHEAKDILCQMVTNEYDPFCRREAVKALGCYDDSNLVRFFNARLQVEESTLVREEISRVLRKYHCQEASETLMFLVMSDRSPDVQVSAINSLAEHGDPRYSFFLLSVLLRSESRTFQSACFRALERIHAVDRSVSDGSDYRSDDGLMGA